MTTNNALVYAPMPQALHVTGANIRITAELAFATLYNIDPEFVALLSGVDKTTYKFGREVDNYLAYQHFLRYCASEGGAFKALTEAPTDQMLSIFKGLRRKTKTSPGARLAIARKAAA